MSCSSRKILFCLCFCWPLASVWADDTKPEQVLSPELAAEIQKLDDQIDEVKAKEKEHFQEIQTVRKKTAEVQGQLQMLLSKEEALQSEQRKLEKERQKQIEEAEKTRKKHEEMKAALEKARKAEEEARKASEKAAKLPAQTQVKITELKEQLPAVQEAAKPVAARNTMLVQELEQLEVIANEFRQKKTGLKKQIETSLRKAGEWVSFSDQIAPIFHEKCLACHNARNPKGQYIMTSYSAIMTSGESEGSIEKGNPEDSLLCMLIEDGSMPKDADPLSPEQLKLVRKWVSLGARLDMASDPEQLLIRIMPHKEQPQPPETYRSPIPVTAVAISASQKLIASSGYHEVLLWSFPEGKLVRRIHNVAERVYGLAFHSDGKRLAVASGTPGRLGEVKLFQVETGELLSNLFVSEDSMFSVAFSKDGQRLAAGGAEGIVAIFNLNAENGAKPLLIRSHSDWVNHVAWSPDGKSLVSGSRDKTAKVYDASTGKLLQTFNGHGANVAAVQITPDNNQALSVGHDRYIRLWNIENGKEVRKSDRLEMPLNFVKLLSDKRAMAGGESGKLFLRNHSDDKKKQSFNISSEWITSFAVSNDQKFFVTGDQSGTIRVNEFEAEQPKADWLAVPVKSE